MTKLDAALTGEIVQILKQDIQEDEAFYDGVIRPALQERWNIYDADEAYYEKKFEHLAKRCNFVATDFANIVGWMLPFLDNVFNSNRQVLKVVIGTGNEDSKAAEVLNKLLKKQLTKDNDGFSLVHLWNKDALITNWAWLMGWWERDYKEVSRVSETVTADVLERYRDDDLIEITSEEEITDPAGAGVGVYNIEYILYEYSKNAPVLEPMPQWEILIDARCRDHRKARRMFHRRDDVTASELRKMKEVKDSEGEPVYDSDAIDRILKGQGGQSESSSSDGLKQQVLETQADDEPTVAHPARREYTVYEGYDQLDINGDGILETVLVTYSSDEILRIEDEDVQLPFVKLSTHMEPHRLFAKRGLADLLGQLQHIRTALWRMIIINAAKTNDAKTFYNPDAVDPDDIENGYDLIELLRTLQQGDLHVEQVAKLDPQTFAFLENISIEQGERSGVTDYTKGSHGTKKLGDTATGITAVMTAANKILEETARIMGETGYKDLFQLLVELNIKYCTPETVYKLTGESFDLSTISAEWDVELQAGLALSTKETSLAAIQMIYQLLTELKQNGWPYVTDENIYAMIKRMAEDIGEKGIEEFVQNPEEFDKQVLARAGIGGMADGAGQGHGAPPAEGTAGGAGGGGPAGPEVPGAVV